VSIELVTNFRCPPLNFINLQVFREVPTSHFHKPTCFYGFLSECCRMLQIWKVNYLWCLRMLQQRSCKNRLFPRFWVVPKSKKVVRTLHLRFILKLKLELFSMLQIQKENDLSWLRMLEQRSLAKIGYFLIFSKCCIQVADEHFAPKHILLLGNTLLLKSITQIAAQHTWQSHNLLFNTPCS
jgi:hypothetical protein